MFRPTMVTICEPKRLLVELGKDLRSEDLVDLGFKKVDTYENVYAFRSEEPEKIHLMCETLRDMSLPYATHRHGGADLHLEWFRDRGYVHGKFKRINFFGNDFDDDAPFTIEEF